MKKIRVGAVNYLNTKPMLYGIRRHKVLDQIELIEDYPANIANLLVENKIDMGLIPVAATLKLKEWHIVSDYGIACDGAVASVCLFSQQPIETLDKVYLDYQSRTSVNLAKILLKEYWKKDVHFIDAGGEDFRMKIKGNAGGVVIGDRALEQRHQSPFIYDLGEAWKVHTGLPFVFAAWVANHPLPENFQKQFDEACAFGLLHLEDVIRENPYNYYSLEKYYRECIHYKIDDRKLEGMQLFLSKLRENRVENHYI